MQFGKKIWDKKDLLIVEGEYTKLGVGNDLFSNVNSIRRIICPSTNAWNYYSDILHVVKQNASPNMLIIAALGPTATILAYDLACSGYWAMDVGHIDIEYEWFLMGACEKVSIEGKYTNESNNTVVSMSSNNDSVYNSQVVFYIGVNQ